MYKHLLKHNNMVKVSTTNFNDDPEKDEEKTKEELVEREQERKLEGGGEDQVALQSRKTVFEKQKKRPEDRRKRFLLLTY